MKTITTKITGDNDLLAQFVFQHADTGYKQVAQNVRQAQFSAEIGEKYVLLTEVIGTSGQKYKLEISGTTKSTYPEDEQTLDDGRDLLLARITA